MKISKPPAFVGAPGDENPEIATHRQSLGPSAEQYAVSGPTISGVVRAESDDKMASFLPKNEGNLVKKAQKPGPERYEINENEPIRL